MGAVLCCFTEAQNSESPSADVAGVSGASVPPRLSLQDVAQQLELPEALVRKRIGFWVAKGVLREVSAGVYDVQESLSTMESTGNDHVDEDGEHSPGQSAVRADSTGADAACTAELEACEAFIQGMLNNYSALPLPRIHNFLQMFMMDPLYTQTEAQLRNLLQKLCSDGKLEFNGVSYTLVRKSQNLSQNG